MMPWEDAAASVELTLTEKYLTPTQARDLAEELTLMAGEAEKETNSRT